MKDDLITIPIPKECEITILGETKGTMASVGLRIIRYLDWCLKNGK